MKKRVLSIICVVALVATMISAGAIYALGSAFTGTAFNFDGNFVEADWTVTNSNSTFESGVKLAAGTTKTGYATAKYKDSYDLTDGFTLEYSAKETVNFNTITAGEIFTGVQIGNVTVGMDQLIKPVILVDGSVKATGTALTTAATGAGIRAWNNALSFDTGIKYTVTYDATAKTLTYAVSHGGTQVGSVVYTDTANVIDVDSADVVLYNSNLKNSNVTYKSIKLDGAAGEGGNGGNQEPGNPPAPPVPSTLYGTGLEINASNPAVAEDWTFNPTGSSVVTTGITLNTGSNNNLQKATYNETFILTEGFTLTYSAKTSSTENVPKNPGKKYLGASVGNITAYLDVVDTKDAVVMKIAVDGTVVATSDVIFDDTHSTWGSSSKGTATGNVEYYFAYYLANSKFTLSYDPATKDVTYSLSVNDIEQGTLTYNDANDTVDVADAPLELISNRSWNANAYYTNIKLVGATCPGHEYDDDNDTTCNKCGEVREIGGGNEPGGNEPGGNEPGGNEPGGNEPAAPKGEALTSKLDIKFDNVDDWTGDTDSFKNGKFVIDGGQTTKTVWSVKKYDLSNGFEFSGDLYFRNSYNNYYGEWCSVYFGNESKNLELRLRNDSANNSVKDDSYTAYLFCNGVELAKYDLDKTVNGKYELTYKDGKVTVTFGGNKIFDNVAVDIDLSNAKLGLRLSNNWCANGRQWSKVSLAPITTDDGQGGGQGGTTIDPTVAPALVGVGVSFNNKKEENYPNGNDWIAADGTTIKLTKRVAKTDENGNTVKEEGTNYNVIIEVPTGKMVLSGGNSDNALKATYKDTFNVSEGFTLTYNVLGSGTKNYTTGTGKPYIGASVGNITGGVEIIDFRMGTRNAIALVLYVDGVKVGQTEPFFSEYDDGWNLDDPTANFYNFFSSAYESNSDANTKPTYVLKYDAATKTVTFTKTLNDDTVAGSITYVDTNNKIKLTEAELSLVSRRSYNVDATYTNVVFEGKPDPNKPQDEIERGETLTSWAPESFLEEDWEDSEDLFVDGAFVIPSGQVTKTAWTVKNYDLSGGFTFKGTLAMKNGYNNFYGEWCSAYFGDKEKSLELRIKNDSANNNQKDNTYTAYIMFKGKELASYDLLTLPNGEYEFSYAGGKVAVSLGGTAIKWTLADGTESTTVPVEGADVILANAKLGLRLSNNYAPNGRKWSAISLASLEGGSINKPGDARNIVIPACAMLVCAVAAAFVLIKKRARA